MSTDDVHPDDMPDELDALFDELRSAAASTTPPVLGDALATLFRDGAAPQPAPSRRRRTALRAVAAGAIAGIAFGGLGVAGALPGPIQHHVADVVDHVGVHLPDDRPDPTTTTTTSTSTTTSTAVTPPPTVLRSPATVPPVPTPSTVDEHGNRGRGNGPGEDNGKHKGQEKHDTTPPTTARDDSGKGRNPHADDDVHPDNSGRGSGHDDDDGSEG